MTDTPTRPASYGRFTEMAPQESDAASRTWIARAANFAVALSEVEPGATLSRQNNPDEYMVILAPGCEATIRAGSEEIAAGSDSLTIVPPGPSSVIARSKGLLARILTKRSEDVIAKAFNAAVYADGAPEVAPLEQWPDPVDGFRIRHYPLAPYYKEGGERIQPRVFRSTTMMVNLFGFYRTRRETNNLSPHWHDDFEQVSLTLFGRWVHHMRWPWGADLAVWHPDEASEMATPSVIVIPAGVVHTSRDVGEGVSSLYDIFSPPRLDFAMKPGFVINEAEYPLPATAEKRTTTKGTLLSWQKS